MKIIAIDLFCGIGGLSYGLKKAGVYVVAGVDLDASCQYAFEANVGAQFIHKDITDLTGAEIKKKFGSSNETVKVLAGCAPCQPFSTHSNKNRNREKSKKWNLLIEFQRIIGESNPDIITMENVPNLSKQKIFEVFITYLVENGYFVSYSNIYCPAYGIPQKRRRLVLLASKMGDISLIPATHSNDEYITLREAIGLLPRVEAGEVCKTDPLHRSVMLSEINMMRIKASKPNGTWLDWDDKLKLNCHNKVSGKTFRAVYGRMSWDQPSSTITTQFYNYGTGRFGHPEQNRALTIREGAILQTFPLDYKFFKKKKEINIKKFARHIGNAVPVELGYAIGKSIDLHIRTHYGKQ